MPTTAFAFSVTIALLIEVSLIAPLLGGWYPPVVGMSIVACVLLTAWRRWFVPIGFSMVLLTLIEPSLFYPFPLMAVMLRLISVWVRPIHLYDPPPWEQLVLAALVVGVATLTSESSATRGIPSTREFVSLLLRLTFLSGTSLLAMRSILRGIESYLARKRTETLSYQRTQL
ncbi:MAG: hypothetical protein HY459_00605 [Parcubacteria group bacterium]|nr:hypothetical protein [Parcubacteria group bacterium]